MVMSYKKLGKGSAAGNYYLNAATVDDYYLNDGVSDDPETMKEPPGIWFDPSGSLPMANAHGTRVAASDFQALLGGYDPTTGQALGKSFGEKHVAGYDFTFSAPKGVSVLWSQLPPELRAEVEAIHVEAVKVALQYMMDHARIGRKGGAGSEKVDVPFMAAIFPHASSREGDPQVHAHCVIPNEACYADGKWGTIDPISMLRWQSPTSAVYHTEFSARLTDRLGIPCGMKDGEFVFDVVGMDQMVKDAWSKRMQKIDAATAGKGDVSKAMRDKAAIETREAKDELTRAQLLEIWREQGKEYGFTEVEALTFLNVATRTELTREDLEKISQEALSVLTRSQSVFSEANLAAAIGVRMQGRGVAADIDRAVNALKETQGVVFLGDSEDTALTMYSTPEMIALERDMVVNAKEDTPQHALQEAIYERAIGARVGISEEQAAAVRHVCSDPHRVSIMEGSAGSGKTFSLAAVIDAYKETGYEVHLLALSWSAAGVLSAEVKEKNARAIEGFVRDVESGKIVLHNKSKIVVDEAGLVGSRHMAKIIEAAKLADAKVVLTGDSLQLAPVDAGGAMAALVEECGSVRINEIRRQGSHVRHDPEQYASFAWQRESVLQLAHGEASKALQAYNAAGFVHFANDHEAAINTMIELWKAGREANPGRSTLLLALDNKSVRELNDLVRAQLKEQGALHGEGVMLQASDMRRSDQAEFSVGDQIMFRMNDREMGIVGDNDEERTGVFNRTQGTIRGISFGADGVPHLQIELTQGGTVEIRAGEGGYWDKERGGVPIQHAYATTVYASQGMTMDLVYCLDSQRFDRKSSYVAASRNRIEFHLIADREATHESMMSKAAADEYRPMSQVSDDERLAAMAKTWSRAGDKVTTLQYLDMDGNLKERVQSSTKAEARQVERPTGGEKDRARAAAASFDERKVQARGIDLPAWLEGRGYTLSRTPGGLQLASGKTGETWSLWQAKEGGNWLARQPNQKTVDSIGLVEKLEGVNFREAVTRLDASGVGQAKRETLAAEQKTSTAYDQVARLTKDARAVDLPAWLTGRGERVEKNGTREFKIRQADGQALRMFQSDKDGTWLITDGRRTFDPIGYVQQREGCTFQEAVKHLAGDRLAAPPVSPPVPPRAPAAPIALRHASAAQHAAGLRYLQGRGISRETTREALEHGFLAIDNRGPAFVGRDAQGQIRSAETRLMTPFTTDAGDVLTKVSYERTDKTYSPILPGDPRSKEVHLVESGMDALALRDIHRRDRPSEPMPAVVVTGGARTLKWRDNPQVVDLLRKAESVTIHKENEKDETGRPNPRTQADTDAAHEKQMEAVSVIRGSDKGLQFERPNEAFKDLAERNAHEVQVLEQARRDQEEEENRPRMRP